VCVCVKMLCLREVRRLGYEDSLLVILAFAAHVHTWDACVCVYVCVYVCMWCVCVCACVCVSWLYATYKLCQNMRCKFNATHTHTHTH